MIVRLAVFNCANKHIFTSSPTLLIMKNIICKPVRLSVSKPLKVLCEDVDVCVG